MDWLSGINTGISFLKKYRYALLAVVIGVVLMSIPEQKIDTEMNTISVTEEKQTTLEDSLAEILSKIDGVGEVDVLLTPSRGEETIYQTDEDDSSGERNANRRTDTVVITGEGRLETGLVKQINPPEYMGAVIVCQGASDPKIRLWIVEAVTRATGLTSDRVTVLKMK